MPGGPHRLDKTNVQLVRIKIPLHKRPKKTGSARRRLPWDIWQQRDVQAALEVQVPLAAEATVEYERGSYRSFSVPPLPHFDLLEFCCEEAYFAYYDGSGGVDHAGWGFLVANWHGDTLFERWGRVGTDAGHPCFLGPETHCKNTGEVSAFMELLLYLFYESPLPWRDTGIVLAYESTYSVGMGTGAWRPGDNAAMLQTALTIWEAFDVVQFPVFGLKVKSRVENRYNGRADELADRGSRGDACPSSRLYFAALVLREVSAFLRASSDRYNPPPARATLPPISILRIYN